MIQKLIEYQQIDSKLHNIEVLLTQNEDRKKYVTAKKYLESVEENVNSLDARASSVIAEYNKILSDKKSLEENGEEIFRAAQEVEDQTETSFIIKKLDEITNKLRQTTSRLAEISKEFSSISGDYSTIKQKTRKAQEMLKENGAKYKEVKDSVAGEREKLKGELDQLKKDIQPELMNRYKEKRDGKMFPILYQAQDKICGKCRMELSGSELTNLKKGEVIECATCGVLLYK